jgi:hypothetical protein
MTGQAIEAGLTMAGELTLMPCEDCGTLIVLHIERVRCVPCLAVTVRIQEAGRM